MGRVAGLADPPHDLFPGKVLFVTENYHLRMVVSGEALVGELVVESERPERGFRMEGAHEAIAELPREEEPIVARGERVLLRQANDRAVEPRGGKRHPVTAGELETDAAPLFRSIRLVQLKLLGAIVSAVPRGG